MRWHLVFLAAMAALAPPAHASEWRPVPASEKFARSLIELLRSGLASSCTIESERDYLDFTEADDVLERIDVPLRIVRRGDGSSRVLDLSLDYRQPHVSIHAEEIRARLAGEEAFRGCFYLPMTSAQRTASETFRLMKCDINQFNETRIPGGATNVDIAQPALAASGDELVVSEVQEPAKQLDLVEQGKNGMPFPARDAMASGKTFHDSWSKGNDIVRLEVETDSKWAPSSLGGRLMGAVKAKFLGQRDWQVLFKGEGTPSRSDDEVVLDVAFASGRYTASVEPAVFDAVPGSKEEGKSLFDGELFRHDEIVMVGAVPVRVFVSIVNRLGYKVTYEHATVAPTGVTEELGFRLQNGLTLVAWGGPDVVVAKGGIGTDLVLSEGEVVSTARIDVDERGARGCGEVYLDKPTYLSGKLFADFSIDLGAAAAPAKESLAAACNALGQFNPRRLLAFADKTAQSFQAAASDIEQGLRQLESRVNFYTPPTSSLHRNLTDTIEGTTEMMCERMLNCDAVQDYVTARCEALGRFCPKKVAPKLSRCFGWCGRSELPTVTDCGALVQKLDELTKVRVMKYLFHWDGMKGGERQVWYSSCEERGA